MRKKVRFNDNSVVYDNPVVDDSDRDTKRGQKRENRAGVEDLVPDPLSVGKTRKIIRAKRSSSGGAASALERCEPSLQPVLESETGAPLVAFFRTIATVVPSQFHDACGGRDVESSLDMLEVVAGAGAVHGEAREDVESGLGMIEDVEVAGARETVVSSLDMLEVVAGAGVVHGEAREDVESGLGMLEDVEVAGTVDDGAHEGVEVARATQDEEHEDLESGLGGMSEGAISSGDVSEDFSSDGEENDELCSAFGACFVQQGVSRDFITSTCLEGVGSSSDDDPEAGPVKFSP
jgi:hypothetical protein